MKLRPIAVLATAALIALTGCASGSTPDSPSASGPTAVKGGPNGDTVYNVTANPELAKQAAEIVKGGTLNLVTAAGAPPYGYIVEGTDELRGSDMDIAYVIAAKLGLTAKFTTMDFSGILPAMQANRFDFSIASMGDTPEREKVVDFVDYSTDSNSIVTTKGNPHNIQGLETLCGLKVSSVQGSVPLGLLQNQNKKCTNKMDIAIFPDNATALLQVQNGRADATMYQTGVASYLIKTDAAAANLEVVENTEYGKGYNAMAFNKSSSQLRDLVQKALTELKTDGVYDEVHAAWGLDLNKIDTITVNDGLKYNQPS